jgi:splicing factor 45
VRYNLPPAPSELPASEAELEKALVAEPEDEDEQETVESEDAPRSLRPGQRGFAKRLMSKYGWSKGSGLGADGSGIVNPLRVQIEKRKKSDVEGGGFGEPRGRGKIIGGKKKVVEKDADVGKFGPMSEVIVLRGMVDGMNLDEEVEGAGDGGLVQEIGDECGEKACAISSPLRLKLTISIVWSSGTSIHRSSRHSPCEGVREIYKPVVCPEGK